MLHHQLGALVFSSEQAVHNLPFGVNFSHRREVFHEHTVNENIPAADFTEQDAFGAVIEETDIVGGMELLRVRK